MRTCNRRTEFFNSLKGLPFWIWGPDSDPENPERHIKADRLATRKSAKTGRLSTCCYNHAIGLPQTRNNIEKPLFNYQKTVLDALHAHRCIWIKKATGLGITELFLRYMSWLALKDDACRGTTMCIVTGPRIDLAETLIDRMKRFFVAKIPSITNQRSTEISLNGSTIVAFPSHHLDAMRGIDRVSFILLDEADYFNQAEQNNARDVSERYIGKSDPYIAMVSTPNLPGGLFEKIEQEDEKACLYKRIFLDYKWGLGGRIYSEQEIAKAMSAPGFKKEYCLAYGFGIGDVVLPSELDEAIELGDKMDNIPTTNMHTTKTLGIDAGYGSSKFAFVITEYVDGKARVTYSEAFDHAKHEIMLTIARNLIVAQNIDKVYVDASNISFIKSLKTIFQKTEIVDYERDQFIYSRRIVPVNFGSGHGHKMIDHLKFLFSHNLIGISSKKHLPLISEIRVARTLDNGNLDKSHGSLTMDLFDAFRLSCIRYTGDGIEIIRKKNYTA